MDFQRTIEREQPASDEIVQKTRTIYETSLQQSKYLDAPNFTTIHPADIERLFDLYDEQFFDGACRELLGDTPLRFRLSKRMTSAAGKATRFRHHDPCNSEISIEYEIAVSTTLLFQTFHDVDRPIMMSGIECRDRLEALQRVFEHELVHLIEFMIWECSSCSAARFQNIANRFFRHTEHTHQLITPGERAFSKFGVQAGSRVSFRLDGQQHIGFVNRITKRATVLVEDRHGIPYSDGKRYKKYYVPVDMLEMEGA